MKMNRALSLFICLSLCVLVPAANAGKEIRRYGICPVKVSSNLDPELGVFMEDSFTDLLSESLTVEVEAVSSDVISTALTAIEKAEKGLPTAEKMERVMEKLELDGLYRGTLRKVGTKYRVGLRAYMYNPGKGVYAAASASFSSKSEARIDAALLKAFTKATDACSEQAPNLLESDAFSVSTKPKKTKRVKKTKSAKKIKASAPIDTVSVAKQSAAANDKAVFGEMSWRDSKTHVRGIYKGEIVNGKPHGYGTLTMVTGESYRGNFVNGARSDNKSSASGKTKKTKVVRKAAPVVTPERIAAAAAAAFFGEIVWRDAKSHVRGSYRGEIFDGMPYGYGTLTMVTGESYRGSFIEGMQSGKGISTLPDGSSISGSFENGIPNGTATMTYANGQTWTGEFVDGAQDGAGEYTTPSGGYGEWVFHNGSFVESDQGQPIQKEAANASMDSLIGTVMALQGLKTMINKVDGHAGAAFQGSGSPPVNSFNSDNSANSLYYNWRDGK